MTDQLTFAGDFETHVTLRLGDATGGEESLRVWAESNGAKYTRIVLDRGETPDQPMLTFRGRGALAVQREVSLAHVQALREAGFEVTRVKIEAAPWNADVPQTVADWASLPPGCYFEHHAKLVLTEDAQVEAIRAVAELHTAHVSRNARRSLDDGRHERFVTQRCRDVGHSVARGRLDALLTALDIAGFPAVDVEEEFVVYDDNPAVDAGWIREIEAVR